MRNFLRATGTVIALAAIALVAYTHYHPHHRVKNPRHDRFIAMLGGPIDRAVIIRPKEISGAITAGSHVAVLVARSVLYRDMYVLSAGTDSKTVTLRATPNQAAALIRLSRTAHHQLVLRDKSAETMQG
jgi:hypothetical protein